MIIEVDDEEIECLTNTSGESVTVSNESESGFSSDDQRNSNSNLSGLDSEVEQQASSATKKSTKRKGTDELLEELLMVADEELLGRVLKKRKQQFERGIPKSKIIMLVTLNR